MANKDQKGEAKFEKVEKLIRLAEENNGKAEKQSDNAIFPSLEYAPLPPGNLSVVNYKINPQKRK